MVNRPNERAQTLGEEVANSLSHGLGFLLSYASLPVLVAAATGRGDAFSVAAAYAFSLTAMLLYFASAVYHALPHGRAKRAFNVLDHSAIYLFIAGSYTPIALGPLRGAWGWTLLGLVWSAATLGVLLKCLNRLRHPGWSTGLYVAMGWLGLIAAGPLVQQLPTSGLLWLLAGGMAYTLGAFIFMFDTRLRFGHFVWHLFVLGGSSCHFFATLSYAA